MMKREKTFLIIKTLIELLVPSIFVLLLLYRPYPPWFTRIFGLNSTFSRIGGITIENNSTKYPVIIYAEKNNPEKKRLLAGPFREFPQCSYLILTPEALYWFDDSKENCSFFLDKISIKNNALLGRAEVTESFKSLCSDCRMERNNGLLTYTLLDKNGSVVLTFSIPENWLSFQDDTRTVSASIAPTS